MGPAHELAAKKRKMRKKTKDNRPRLVMATTRQIKIALEGKRGDGS